MPIPTSVSSPKPTTKDLETLGFSDRTRDVPRRLIASIEAREKCGKTHFAATAAELHGPVWYFDIDAGNEGVIEKFQVAGMKLYVKSVRVPRGAPQSKYVDMWQDLKKSVSSVFAHNEGTMVMDTSTEGFELARLAHFGKLTQVMPHHYTEVNSEWREFMKLAYDSTMSSIWIHKVKAQYINDKRTGVYELAGFNDMPYQVQINVVLGREKIKTDDGDDQLFTATVRDCRQNPKVNGLLLKSRPVSEGHLIDPILNWDMLLSLVHDK